MFPIPQKHILGAMSAIFVGGDETRAALADMHAAASESLQSAITRGDVRGPLANTLTAVLAMQKARDEFVFKLHDTDLYRSMARIVAAVERMAASGHDFEEALVTAFHAEFAGVEVSEVDAADVGINQAEGGATVDTEQPAEPAGQAAPL